MTNGPGVNEFPPDPDLGQVIVVKAGIKNALIGGVVLVLIGLGLLLGAFGAWQHPSQSSSGSPYVAPVILSVLCLALFAGAGVAFYKARDKHVFYDQGVALYRKDRRLKSIRYDDADTLTMKQVRMYHNGVYTGTSVTLKWHKANNKIYVYNGTYKETMQKGGFLTMLRQTFVDAPTDLDAVRDIAASTLSPRFVQTLAQGQPILLDSGHSATSQGLIPGGGPLKRQLVPYAAIEDMQVRNFKLHVTSGGREIMTCPTNSPNFWPKFYAVQEFWLAAAEASNSEAPADVQES